MYTSVFFAGVAAFVVTAGISYLQISAAPSVPDLRVLVVKSAMGLSQILGVMQGMNIEWPPAVMALLGLLKTGSGGTAAVIGPECAFTSINPTYGMGLVLSFMPIIIGGDLCRFIM